ncbi:MAG: DUF748 domain-containing protein [Candidatus Omnitrophica bacterium]|nr:DUF748 domain-containing protein [Candidatus Omnitrophota bacterium]
MKPWMKVLAIAAVLAAVVFTAANVFLVFQGKALLVSLLKQATGRNVTLGSLELIPPLQFNLRDLQIEGILKAESISITPGFLGLIAGRISVNSLTLVKPEFIYEKDGSGPAAFRPPAFLEKLIIGRLNVRDGALTFIDHGVGLEGIVLHVNRINVTLVNSYVPPKSLLSKFELTGKIPWEGGGEEGSIELEGWLDILKKDMQATLNLTGIDGIYLYPYYSSWVDIEKARIEKAKLNFTSSIQGLNNNITAHCRLELTDIVRKPRPSDVPAERAERITDVVLDIFRALNEGKIVLDFTIRTKMDRPEFGLGDIQSAVKDTIVSARKGKGPDPSMILAVPLKVLEGTIKGVADVSRAMIDGSYAIGKELKDVFEETFKTE